MVELRDATQADAHAIATVLVQSWRAAYRGLQLRDPSDRTVLPVGPHVRKPPTRE